MIWRFAAIFWFYCLRQSRYRQKTKNRLPPKHHRRMALPPKNYHHTWVLLPPPKSLPLKKRKTAYRQTITAVWHYRPKSTAICYTAYKSISMSEWSERMALRLLVGIRGLGFKPTPRLYFCHFFAFCSLFFWLFDSIGLLFGRTPC